METNLHIWKIACTVDIYAAYEISTPKQQYYDTTVQ